jgi:hypothetical protein
VEEALVAYLQQRKKEIRDREDRAALDRHADGLNQEAADVLSYQVTV